MSNRPSAGGRLPDLDFLRAMAILLVLGRHVLLIPEDLPRAAQVFWQAWNRCGWMGVDLFFTLSGFLVSGLLFREYQQSGRVSPLRFLIRRGLKIYPAFYAFLALSLAVSLAAGLHGRPELMGLSDVFPRPTLGRVMGEVLFLQNYRSYLWGHTWSLAVEEHFYIGLACLVAAMVRWRKGAAHLFSFVPPMVLAVAVLLLAARLVLGYGFHRPWWQILAPTHLRIDSLLYGVLLSYFYHLRHAQTVAFVRRFRRGLALSAAAMIAPALVLRLDDPFMYTIGLTFLYLAFGNLIMLLRVWDSPRRDFLMHHMRLASYLGRHSYSIYLWHMPMYVASIALVHGLTGGRQFVLEIVFYMAGTILVGTGMSLLVEQPVLRLRDHLFPSRTAAV